MKSGYFYNSMNCLRLWDKWNGPLLTLTKTSIYQNEKFIFMLYKAQEALKVEVYWIGCKKCRVSTELGEIKIIVVREISSYKYVSQSIVSWEEAVRTSSLPMLYKGNEDDLNTNIRGVCPTK